MKLGVFDSGLGGLSIAKAIHESMPDLDMLYLGDTLRLPYGNRSDEAIYRFTKRAIEYLFAQECTLVIIACNTASARALRRLQQTYLPAAYPQRNVLGVIVPTLEAAVDHTASAIGVIATNATVNSNIYPDELEKLAPSIQITQQATPLLVPLIENDGAQWMDMILSDYLIPLQNKGVEAVILGCTHYSVLKDRVARIMGDDVDVISQTDIIPAKLQTYLDKHPEYADKITRHAQIEFHVSDLTPFYQRAAEQIYGRALQIQEVVL